MAETVIDVAPLLTNLVNLGAAGVIGYLAIQRIDAFGERLDRFHATLIDVIRDQHSPRDGGQNDAR